MWYLLVLYISIFALIINKKVPYCFWRGVALANLLFIGFIGTIPFFLTEFFFISYFDSLRILSIGLILSALIKLFWTLKNDKASKICIPRFNIFSLFYMILASLLLVRGFSMPVSGWDAYAMYDGRARYLSDGLKFSELGELTKYDDTNYLYYFGYPPSTSVAHAVIYSSGLSTPMFIYSMFYLSLAIFVILIVLELKIPSRMKILFVLLGIGSHYIFEPITSAYTNLPMISYLIGSLYFILEYTKNKNLINLFVSVLLMSLASWTRVLEPLFVAFYLPLMYVLFSDKSKSIYKRIMVALVSTLIVMSPRVFWTNYVTKVVGNIEGNMPNLGYLIDKLIKSMSLDNAIEVSFFIYTSLRPISMFIFLFGVAILYLYSYRIKIKSTLVIILFTIIFIVSIMTAGTFYLSATFDWWNTIPGSYLRSNLVLLPLISIAVAYTYESLINDKNEK